MAESITSGSIQLNIKFTVSNGDPVLPQTVNQPAGASKTLSFKTGGVSPYGAADKLHYSHRTLPLSGTETIDLFTTGALLTPYGAQFGITKLLALAILLDASPAGSAISIAPGASAGLAAPWSGTTPADVIKNGYAGGMYMLPPAVNASGYTVDNTHKNITITNLDGALGVGYSLFIVGKA